MSIGPHPLVEIVNSHFIAIVIIIEPSRLLFVDDNIPDANDSILFS